MSGKGLVVLSALPAAHSALRWPVLVAILLVALSSSAHPQSAAVRLPMEQPGGAPVVAVTINGEGPFPFLIEAASSRQACVDPQLVQQCRLPPAASADRSVTIRELGLGETAFASVRAGVAEISGRSTGTGGRAILGTLGLGLFADRLLTVDFPGRQILLEEGELAAGADHVVPLEWLESGPALTVTLAGREFPAEIDWSSPDSLVVPAGTGELLDGPASIAGHSLPKPAISVSAGAGAALLGLGILRDFSLTFDQRSARLRLDRRSRPRAPGAAAPAPPGSPEPSLPPEETRLPWSPTVVPMDLAAGVPIVLATVNGKGPFPFFLHTGSQATMIDRRLAEELGLAPDARAPEGISAGIPVVAGADLVRVEELCIGQARFGGIQALLCDCGAESDPGTPPAARGVLGFSLFARCLLSIDYPGARVVLQSGELMVADGQRILDFTLENGLPTIELRAGDVPIAAHLDTGATGGIMIPAQRRHDLRLRGQPEVIGRARLVNEEFVLLRAILEGKLKLGVHELEDQEVILNGALRDFGTMGSSFLAGFELVFDQRNRRVRVSTG